jgi:hypothetical protein
VVIVRIPVPKFVDHNTPLSVFVDPDLLRFDEVRAAAGTGQDVFGAPPTDLVRVTGGVVTDLKRAWASAVSGEPSQGGPSACAEVSVRLPTLDLLLRSWR